MLDACSFAQRFWVFAGGLTDVGTTLRITDTRTGAVQEYTNTLGTPFLALGALGLELARIGRIAREMAQESLRPTRPAAQLTAPVPHYRFSVLIQRAKNLTATVIQLGAALLSALEKKDAEELSKLRALHETNVLALNSEIREKEIEAAQTAIEELDEVGIARRNFRHLDPTVGVGIEESHGGGGPRHANAFRVHVFPNRPRQACSVPVGLGNKGEVEGSHLVC